MGEATRAATPLCDAAARILPLARSLPRSGNRVVVRSPARHLYRAKAGQTASTGQEASFASVASRESPRLLTSPTSLDPKSIGIGTVYEWIRRLPQDGHRTNERDARIVHCPAANHADKSPSCKLHLTKHVFFCFSCGAGGGILDMIIAADLVDARAENPRQLAQRWLEDQVHVPHPAPIGRHALPKPHQIRGKKLINEEQTATFFYTEVDGTVSYRVVRIQGFDENGKRAKRFEAHAWRNGKWLRGMFGTPPIPYHLPELAAATAAHGTAILLEGEQDATTIAQLGFTTTTTPFGSGFSIPEAWKPYFTGLRELVIVPDADFAGRRAAERRAKALAGTADVVRIIDPWPERNDGFDATNLVLNLYADGYDELAVRHIVATTFEIELPQVPEPQPLLRHTALHVIA
jgi:hypothetical protein